MISKDSVTASVHLNILQAVADGRVSGTFAEWPQLRSACAWAIIKIKQLQIIEENVMQNHIKPENESIT